MPENLLRFGEFRRQGPPPLNRSNNPPWPLGGEICVRKTREDLQNFYGRVGFFPLWHFPKNPLKIESQGGLKDGGKQ